MAVIPNADADCFWHSVQWQMYTARGFGKEARKVTVPHWQEIFAFLFSFCGLTLVVVVVADGTVDVDWYRFSADV